MWTIENVGRRKVSPMSSMFLSTCAANTSQSLLIGALAQAACAIIAGLVGHFYTASPGVSAATKQLGGNILIAFAVIHVSCFSLFWGPTPWVLYVVSRVWVWVCGPKRY
jgi:SP family sugar:H+ symporter-like MFS transporter